MFALFIWENDQPERWRVKKETFLAEWAPHLLAAQSTDLDRIGCCESNSLLLQLPVSCSFIYNLTSYVL